jgi:hypothetical protein
LENRDRHCGRQRGSLAGEVVRRVEEEALIVDAACGKRSPVDGDGA